MEIKEIKYGEAVIRIVSDDDGIWIAARDVAKALDFSALHNVTIPVAEEDKITKTIPTSGGRQNATLINMNGLMRIAFNSRKEKATDFRKWVLNEATPVIREIEHAKVA